MSSIEIEFRSLKFCVCMLPWQQPLDFGALHNFMHKRTYWGTEKKRKRSPEVQHTFYIPQIDSFPFPRILSPTYIVHEECDGGELQIANRNAVRSTHWRHSAADQMHPLEADAGICLFQECWQTKTHTYTRMY